MIHDFTSCPEPQNNPQTSVDPSVEEKALKTFVVFERGDSGDLTYNQFKKVSLWYVVIIAKNVFWSFFIDLFHFEFFVLPVSNQIQIPKFEF